MKEVTRISVVLALVLKPGLFTRLVKCHNRLLKQHYNLRNTTPNYSGYSKGIDFGIRRKMLAAVRLSKSRFTQSSSSFYHIQLRFCS